MMNKYPDANDSFSEARGRLNRCPAAADSAANYPAAARRPGRDLTDLLSNDLDPASFDAFYRREHAFVAGTDEAGRGPLAGPVVAAAVILDPKAEYPGLGDSKKLSPAARNKAFDLICSKALAWAWSAVEAPEVDRLNPLASSMLAMEQAVAQLIPQPSLTLVDGNSKPKLTQEAVTVVKGDARSLSIGAASIVAKVIRDRLMLAWHQAYPQYHFDRHKGYGTAVHLAALRLHGPCPCHRLSYRGVLDGPPRQAGFKFEADE